MKIAFSVLFVAIMICLLTQGCRERSHTSEALTDTVVAMRDSAQEAKLRYKGKVNETGGYTQPDKILEILHIKNRNGAPYRISADTSAHVAGLLPYGTEVQVYLSFGTTYMVAGPGNERVYIKKTDAGTASDFILEKEDLFPDNAGLTITGKEITGNKEGEMKKYLDIGFTGKETYLRMKRLSRNYFLTDTKDSKKNGVIILKTPRGNKYFRDRDDTTYEESNQKYHYLGQLQNIDRYLISGSYYESSDYKLIDKNNGDSIILSGYPHLSAGGKYLVSIASDPYESYTGFELYKISGKQPEMYISTAFDKWWLTGEAPDDVFWDGDNVIYLRATSMIGWSEKGAVEQYIKITIK